MEYNNLDATQSFGKLKSLKPFNIKTGLTKERIKKYIAKQGGGLTYSYAAMPVDEKILSVLQQLSEEQEVIEKYKGLLKGDIINTGEGRSVLHQLARGQVLSEKVIIDGKDKAKFYFKVAKENGYDIGDVFSAYIAEQQYLSFYVQK